jgi:hypothetical protein
MGGWTVAMTNETLIEAWLGVVDHVKREEYAPLDPADLEREPACVESKVWAGCFFAPEADPYREANAARHLYHLARPETYDFLLHEYTCRGIEIVATETANFSCVRAHRPGTRVLESADRRLFVESLANEVLRMADAEQPWRFQFPEVLGEGVIFSTNPEASLYSMRGWRARADGLIRHGVVHFLCYRKMQQRLGFRNDQKWFSDDFRRNRAAPRPGGGGEAGPSVAGPPAGEAGHCPQCGAAYGPGSRYCAQCGSRLGG